MGFREVASLDADVVTALGGKQKNGKANPRSVEGYYLGFRMVENKRSKTGESKLHFFQTAKGNIGVWGKTDLDRKLVSVALGTMTRATFDKMKACPGKNDMYLYKVETDTENVIEVADLPDNQESQSDGGEPDSTEPEYEQEEETDVDADEPPVDELPPARAARPQQAAPTPDAARQAKVQALLSKTRARTA